MGSCRNISSALCTCPQQADLESGYVAQLCLACFVTASATTSSSSPTTQTFTLRPDQVPSAKVDTALICGHLHRHTDCSLNNMWSIGVYKDSCTVCCGLSACSGCLMGSRITPCRTGFFLLLLGAAVPGGFHILPLAATHHVLYVDECIIATTLLKQCKGVADQLSQAVVLLLTVVNAIANVLVAAAGSKHILSATCPCHGHTPTSWPWWLRSCVQHTNSGLESSCCIGAPLLCLTV